MPKMTKERWHELEALRLAGKRRCEYCGGEFNLTRENFYSNERQGKPGFMYVCIPCHCKQQRLARRIKGLDCYYATLEEAIEAGLEKDRLEAARAGCEVVNVHVMILNSSEGVK